MVYEILYRTVFGHKIECVAAGDQRAEAVRGAIAGIAVGGVLFAFMPQIMRGVVWAVLALRPLLG